MTEEGVIGIDGRLPWHLPADMAWFRQHTLGKPVLMGRNTFKSIGAALPDRKNIILTHQATFEAKGCTVVHSIDEALEAAGDVPELVVIGGENCYSQILPLSDRLYITIVHGSFKGDASFPPFDPAMWVETSRREYPADEANPLSVTFLIMEKAEDREP